jgi:hypothetical protein
MTALVPASSGTSQRQECPASVNQTCLARHLPQHCRSDWTMEVALALPGSFCSKSDQLTASAPASTDSINTAEAIGRQDSHLLWETPVAMRKGRSAKGIRACLAGHFRSTARAICSRHTRLPS